MFNYKICLVVDLGVCTRPEKIRLLQNQYPNLFDWSATLPIQLNRASNLFAMCLYTSLRVDSNHESLSILDPAREDSNITCSVPQLAGLGRYASNPTQSGFESSRNVPMHIASGPRNKKGRHFVTDSFLYTWTREDSNSLPLQCK